MALGNIHRAQQLGGNRLHAYSGNPQQTIQRSGIRLINTEDEYQPTPSTQPIRPASVAVSHVRDTCTYDNNVNQLINYVDHAQIPRIAASPFYKKIARAMHERNYMRRDSVDNHTNPGGQ